MSTLKLSGLKTLRVSNIVRTESSPEQGFQTLPNA